ncbi:hypothetical protein MASR1M97_04520 [Candidatus Desulfobacillus denitrificans]
MPRTQNSGQAHAFGISLNGQLCNEQRGHDFNDCGLLSNEDLFRLGAEPVNPSNEYNRVFLFPVSNAVNSGLPPYDATRSAWKVGLGYRTVQKGDLAVGIDRGISIGVFGIGSWRQADTDTGKFEFESDSRENKTSHELFNKNCSAIINSALGFWQRGNYLIVKFDGKGGFNFIRGSRNTQLQNLLAGQRQ